MAAVAPPQALADIEDLESGVSYPGHLLAGHETALVLFSAAWHGRQDAYWIHKAGLRATCVDTDRQRLKEMRAIYPADWVFWHEDAFEFADLHCPSDWFDVVSLDPFTNLFDQCAEMLPRWCDIARNLVILGAGEYTVVDAPKGWEITHRRKRSDYHGGVYWIVLERV